jgi:hypothetical protein
VSDYLTQQYAKLNLLTEEQLDEVRNGSEDPNFGLDEDSEQQEEEQYLATCPSVVEVAPHILAAAPRDTGLWVSLFQLFPAWTWGRQKTGDCVSWAKAHNVDTTIACLVADGRIGRPDSLASNESIYGFAKANLTGNYGRKGSGSTSHNGSLAVERFGWLHRRRYVSGSGHVVDLRDQTSYSITWGENPGSGVPTWLHPIAAVTKAIGMVRAENATHAGKLIQAGYAVDFSGNIPWPRTRDANGLGTTFSRGAHMVSFTGVRWNSDGTPHSFWLANTGHGNHVSGPIGPLPVPVSYAQCGGWISASTANGFFTGVRNYAHTMVTGWPILKIPHWNTSEWL